MLFEKVDLTDFNILNTEILEKVNLPVSFSFRRKHIHNWFRK